MSSSTELKARLEAIRVERERREQETHEQEERELQSLMEEEDRARREQQRADEEKKRAAETKWKAEEERVAGGQRPTAETEGAEGSQEADVATGEGWETDIARLHAAAMAGGSRDDGEEYRAMEDTCWNCRHRKLVCEHPE